MDHHSGRRAYGVSKLCIRCVDSAVDVIEDLGGLLAGDGALGKKTLKLAARSVLKRVRGVLIDAGFWKIIVRMLMKLKHVIDYLIGRFYAVTQLDKIMHYYHKFMDGL